MCTKFCVKHFPCITLLNPHNSMEFGIITIPISQMRKLGLRDEKWWGLTTSKQEWSPDPHDSKAWDFSLHHFALVWLNSRNLGKMPLEDQEQWSSCTSSELAQGVPQSRPSELVVRWMRGSDSRFNLQRLPGAPLLEKRAHSSHWVCFWLSLGIPGDGSVVGSARN